MAYEKCLVADRRIVREYRRLGSGTKVANLLGYGDRTVYRVLREAGIDTRENRKARIRIFGPGQLESIISEYSKGISATSLAKKHKCAVWTILEAMRRRGIRTRGWTRISKKELLKAKELYLSGLTLKKVAEELGRGEHAFTRVLNLKFPEIIRSKIVGPGGPRLKYKRRISHGYAYIWIGDDDPMKCMVRGRYILEHRLIMARKLGRSLRDSETVHHINGDCLDNRPENLQLRQGKHGKHIAMCCLDCGSHNIGHSPLR